MSDSQFEETMTQIKEKSENGILGTSGASGVSGTSETFSSGLPKDDPAVQYEPISSVEGKFCGNCRFYYSSQETVGDCSPVKGEINHGGYCNLWREIIPLTQVMEDNEESDEEAKRTNGKKSKSKPKSSQSKPSKSYQATESSTFKETSPSGKEWLVRVISVGLSKNGNLYTEEVLESSVSIFDKVPVFASFGTDHNSAERGFKSQAGFIKDPYFVKSTKNTIGGIEATFHVSDEDIQTKLLDYYNEGILTDMVGFSIVANGEWIMEGGARKAIKLTEADSVDLVISPAAGGKFIKVTESDKSSKNNKSSKSNKNSESNSEGDSLMPDEVLTEERVNELLDEKLTSFGDSLLEKLKINNSPSGESNNTDNTDEDDDNFETVSESTLSPSEIRMSKMVLSNMLTESKLPEVSVNRIKEQFANGVSDFDKVEEAINSEKDYIASLQKSKLERFTTESNGRVTVDEYDKLIARIDAVFDVVGEQGHSGGMMELKTPEGGSQKIPAFTSFKEAYCIWTGESPWDVSAFDIWKALSTGMAGYDSADIKRRNKTYEALGTGDWTNVVIDRLHNALLLNYDNLPQYQDWRMIARPISVTDFQPWRDTKVGGYANLPVVVERGTYPELTHPSDEQTSATLAKHGGIASQITRELIINDKIGAISQIPKELARAAARTLYEAVFDVLVNNATYGPDSTALFDATHNNTGTTTLSISGVDVATRDMRLQTKFGSTADVLGAANTPRIIIVRPHNQGLAQRIANPSQQVITRLDADTDADQDPMRFAGQLTVIVIDYDTSDTAEYYLAADPDLVAGIGVLFLNGRQEPELFVQANETVGEMFTQDVQNIKVRHEWQTVLRDFRPFYRST